MERLDLIVTRLLSDAHTTSR